MFVCIAHDDDGCQEHTAAGNEPSMIAIARLFLTFFFGFG